MSEFNKSAIKSLKTFAAIWVWLNGYWVNIHNANCPYHAELDVQTLRDEGMRSFWTAY